MAGIDRIYKSVVLTLVFCIVIMPSPVFSLMDVRLLLTGDFHGDEVSAETGERWTGLFKTNTGFELAGTVVKVEMVEDAVLDGPGQKTGKKVSVDREDEPVFLFSGVEGLKEGPVEAAFSGREWLNPGVVKDLRLAGNEYSLSAHGQGKDDWSIKGYSLLLTSGGVSQEIVRYDTCCNDNMPSIIWAGDIDGDGALDLFLDLSNHYNMTRPTLLLSSLAGEGELVGRAAGLVTYGC